MFDGYATRDLVILTLRHEVPGYQFSAAMQAKKGEKWDPEKLNQWLWNPQSLIKGTKMTFAGIPDGQKRADVIAYLESLK